MDDYVENQIEFTNSILIEWSQFPDREQFHIDRLRKVAKYASKKLKKNSAILDVGCRNGQLLEAFVDLGFKDLTGVDISAAAIAHGEKKGLDVVEWDCHEPFVFGKKRFDLVALIHVIEHCYDVDVVLQNVKEVLKKNGFVIVEVPIQEKRETPTQFMHYSIFHSAPYLLRVMERNGFTYVEDKPESWGYGALFRKVE